MSLPILTRSVNRGRYLNDVLGSRAFNAGKNLPGKLDEQALKSAKPFKSIPTVPMVPLIGSSWSYWPYVGKYSVDKMHIADIDKNMKYGEIVREKFGRLDVVNCYNPEAMYAIMKNDDEYPSRGDFATLKAYRSKRQDWYQPGGLLVTEGKEWKGLRDAIQEYTSKPDFLEYYIATMNEIARDLAGLLFLKRDNRSEVHDLLYFLNRWSLEAITYVAIDKRLGCLEPRNSSAVRTNESFIIESQVDLMQSVARKMIRAMEIQLDCMNKLEASAGNIQFWKYLPTPTWRKFVKAADSFTSLAFKVWTAAAIDKKIMNSDRPNLLKHFTRSANAGASAAMTLMTDLLMAGMDTTANTAGFLLYELAKNPEIQEKAFQEITELLPAVEDKLTFDKYMKLKYLKNCLKESMRLHPIARGNIRIFKNDIVLCGYRIPAGTAVICVLQVINKSPKYFSMPNDFMPERWEGENKYQFFQPFGYGARNCVGNTLSELEILTMVTEVLRHFTLENRCGELGMMTKLINAPDRRIDLALKERSDVLYENYKQHLPNWDNFPLFR